MGKVDRKIHKRMMAKLLAAVLLAAEAIPAVPAFAAFGLPTAGQEDLWERAEQGGEVMVSFPGTITAELSGPEDVDRYSFRLEETTDLLLTLGCDSRTELALFQGEELLKSSALRHSQVIELDGLEAGVYTAAVLPTEETEAGEYELRFQSSNKKNGIPDYSEAHIAGIINNRKSPFRWLNLTEEEEDFGGFSQSIMHYLAHWQGPVDNSVAPYYDKEDLLETPSDYIDYKKAEPKYHVQEMIVLPGRNAEGYEEHWKNAILTYGALDSSFWANGFRYSGTMPYLYSPPVEEAIHISHATTIVGWDDTIPREKFVWTASGSDAQMPEQDGAWICKDSNGTKDSFTDEGYFYVSYEDVWLGNAKVGFEPVAYLTGEQRDNYSHLYSNTPGGMLPLGFNEGAPSGYSEVFETGDEAEMLRAVGFGAANGELSYRISLRMGEEEPKVLKTGYEKYGGFHTERLDAGILLPANTRFEVIIEVESALEEALRFYAAANIPDYMEGIRELEGRAFSYEAGALDQPVDMSAEGYYPVIMAYTDGAGTDKITLLDVRETVTATDSNGEESSEETETPTASNAAGLRSMNGARGFEKELVPGSNPIDVTLPERYDLREEGLITKPKSQGKSSICWTFSGVAALESSFLKSGANLINYPKGIQISSGEETPMENGEIQVKLPVGEETTLSFGAELLSDSENFNPGSQQILWEVTGEGDGFTQEVHVTDNGESAELLTVKKPGTYRVTATALADGYLSASVQVAVTEKAPAVVTLDRTSLILTEGEAWKLNAQVEAEEELTVTWSSDNPAVADVGADGTVLALKKGTARITARAGDGMAVCEVTVRRRTSSSDEENSGEDSGNRDSGEKRFHPSLDTKYVRVDTITGVWKQDGTGWWFERPDGSYAASSWEKIHGKWYYFGADGYVDSGWHLEKDGATERWYYLDTRPETLGQMRTGWLWIGSAEKGSWFLLGADGVMKTGWYLEERTNRWFYLETDGRMACGWRFLDGKWYYFHQEPGKDQGRMYAKEQTPDGYSVEENGEWRPN